jgi:two-component system OmpR family response regulator
VPGAGRKTCISLRHVSCVVSKRLDALGKAAVNEEPCTPFRVLCVDDHRDTADSTVLLFTIVGFEARAAYDGPSALKIAEAFRPSVCVIDYNMPDMNGVELADRLRNQPGSCVLLIVGVSAMSRIDGDNFDVQMIKPADPAKLLEIVNALFHLSEQAVLRPASRR